MTFSVITKNSEKTFKDKELVNISSKEGYDFCVNFGFDFMLTIKYDIKKNRCTILNQFNCKNILFKGAPLPQTIEVDKTCRLLVKDSDEFIQIRINEGSGGFKVASEQLTEEDLKDFYGEKVNTAAKLKLEKRKTEIEEARTSIIKEVYYNINDLTHKLSMNSKTGILLHIALILASILLAFGCANYFAGLPIKEAGNILQMPVNIKLIVVFSLLIYAIGLVFKQGIFLMLQNRASQTPISSYIGEKLMLVFSVLFYSGVYIINLLYYVSPKTMPFFAVFLSLFFTLICVIIGIGCGYYKFNNVELSKELNKYEYREDFELVIREYRQWIERYINTLSKAHINNLKDTLFNLQVKSGFEIFLGILTAPFLAYGVSNTLAMCFPEAAGWIRISTLKFSPVFLSLASFMIIFAFFIFVNAFLCNRKIQSSNVIKNDGFSDYMTHGVRIYGLQGIKQLNMDLRRSFIIGLCIIFIEFTMNVSYFMQEMGEDFTGILISFLGALVPTALLIAETFMLSKTKFQIDTGNELLAKMER